MKASIKTMHHQDGDWLRELAFYQDEIAILTTRLEEVISKNTDKAVTSLAEHYQNKFILLRETVDTLKHDIHIREHEVEHTAEEHPDQINKRYSVQNDRVYNRMKDLSVSFAEIRFEFNKFLAKNL